MRRPSALAANPEGSIDRDARQRRAILCRRQLRQAVLFVHVNSHRFLLRDSVWALPGVTDITAALKCLEFVRG
jgi:hypothetical protein